MARDRLFDMMACFTLTDAQLKELEPILEQHLRVIWEPANAAVVDEMWLLTTSYESTSCVHYEKAEATWYQGMHLRVFFLPVSP